MNNKTYELLRFLINNTDTEYTIKSLSSNFKVSEKTIRNYISSIEDFLKKNNITNTLIKRNDKISFIGNEIDANNILTKVTTSGFYDYKLSCTERQFIISLTLLLSDKYITLNYLEEMLFTSKVTISQDMKQVIENFKLNNIFLNENKHRGFLLNIKESQRRDHIYSLIKTLNVSSKDLIENTPHNISIWFFNNKLNINIYNKRIETALSIIEQHYKFNMSDEDFYDTTLMASIILSRMEKDKYIENDFHSKEILNNNEKIANRFFHLVYENKTNNIFPKNEINYFSKFISTKRIIMNDSEITDDAVNFYIIVRSFLYKLSGMLHIDLLNDYKLQEFLTAHIIAMDNRIKNNEHLINPYKKDMIKNYNKEYEILNKTKYLLEEAIGEKINDDEVTYVLMHIIASIERLKNNKGIPKVLVCCHAGFGTSHFLAENLKNNFKIDIIDVTSSHYIKSQIFTKPEELKKQCDFIISTTPIIGLPIPWLQVNPLLTQEDLNNIHKMIEEVSANLPAKTYKEENFGKEKNISETLNLKTTLKEKNQNTDAMLSSLLNEKNILLDKHSTNWKDAIIMAGEPLLWSDKVEAGYLRAMINNVLDNGPYFVFIPGVALAHAHPEFGAKELGASFMRLKEPISFGHPTNDPVSIIIALSVINAKEHLNMLFTTMNILTNENAILKLKEAKKTDEIINIFKFYEKNVNRNRNK